MTHALLGLADALAPRATDPVPADERAFLAVVYPFQHRELTSAEASSDARCRPDEDPPQSRSRIRGSSRATSRSATRVERTKSQVVTRTVPITSG